MVIHTVCSLWYSSVHNDVMQHFDAITKVQYH